jgi:hypothetical protein
VQTVHHGASRWIGQKQAKGEDKNAHEHSQSLYRGIGRVLVEKLASVPNWGVSTCDVLPFQPLPGEKREECALSVL